MVCPPAEPDPWQRRPRLLDFLLGMGEPLALLLRGPCRRSLSDYGDGQEGGTDDAELITGLGLGFTVRLCADAVAPATPRTRRDCRSLTLGGTDEPPPHQRSLAQGSVDRHGRRRGLRPRRPVLSRAERTCQPGR